MTDPVPTYDCFEIHTLLPAPGWQVVYHDDQGRHVHSPLAALALATKRTFECRSGYEVNVFDEPPGCLREIVGVEYTPDEGFRVCEEARNYCGLMAPGMTLLAYEQLRTCHRHLTRTDTAGVGPGAAGADAGRDGTPV